MVSTNHVSYVCFFDELPKSICLMSDVVTHLMAEHIPITKSHQEIDFRFELIIVEAQLEVVAIHMPYNDTGATQFQ